MVRSDERLMHARTNGWIVGSMQGETGRRPCGPGPAGRYSRFETPEPQTSEIVLPSVA